MKKFLTKIFRFSLIGIVPFLILIIIYVVLDPFKVIKSYDSLINPKDKCFVGINQDYVSTTTFINNSSKINYNSFIFGNSRSMFYQVAEWKKHLSNNSNCYHFDASGEGIWAINKKIEFIDKEGKEIKNVLLIFDYSTLIRDKPRSGHLFMITPALVNNSNLIDFHKTCLSSFLSPKFLYTYLDFKITGKIKPYMKENFLLDDRPRNYDVLTNEFKYNYFEKMMYENKYYTPERLSVFYNRDTIVQKFSPPALHDSQKKILNKMNSILKKHNTNVKIVINPLYNQMKLNNNDLVYLKHLFGSDKVFDFSGINKFTNDYKNYYEAEHYRPQVAAQIMEIVYKNQLNIN